MYVCAWPFYKMQSILASQIVHIWFRGCCCILGHYPQQVFLFICSGFLKSARHKKQHPNCLLLPFWQEPSREWWSLGCEVLYDTFCPVFIRTDSAQSSVEQAQLCYLQWDKMEWYFFCWLQNFPLTLQNKEPTVFVIRLPHSCVQFLEPRASLLS